MKVLVIDAARRERRALIWLLTRAGADDTADAEGGPETLARAQSGSFGLFAMDLTMPVLNGLAACG